MCLAGGGVKGAAYIGVIKALDKREDIKKELDNLVKRNLVHKQKINI